jgi:hypothetical protein
MVGARGARRILGSVAGASAARPLIGNPARQTAPVCDRCALSKASTRAPSSGCPQSAWVSIVDVVVVVVVHVDGDGDVDLDV